MSTTFDAKTNKIIDSPQMIKDGDNRLEGSKDNQKTEEPKPTTTDEGDKE